MSDRPEQRDPHAPKHPERIEPTWPHSEDGANPVSELAAEAQGAESPFGSDVELPVPLERHGRIWGTRPEGSERHDTPYAPDEGP